MTRKNDALHVDNVDNLKIEERLEEGIMRSRSFDNNNCPTFYLIAVGNFSLITF